MENRTYKQKSLRIRYSTYLKLKRAFPSIKDETMVRYFERLAKYLETMILNKPHTSEEILGK